MTKEKPSKQSPNSQNSQQQKLNWLKENLPEIFTEDKIDCDKLKQTLGENVNTDSERYGLSWAGKQNCFKEIQRKTTATLRPNREESVNFDDTENIFIEGENLEVLKVLQKSYHNKVKMIYIDPPYNTGNDFIYRDNYSETEKEYLDKAGELDEEGNLLRDFRKNSKDGGRYHSNWLNMMYPRLYLARNLLKDDGVIFVSIDDNEVHNLRMVMNEIFGEENFVGQFIRQSKVGGGSDSRHIVKEHEYIIAFAKSEKELQDFHVPHDEKYLKRYKEEDENGRFFWDTLARPGLKNPIEYTVEAPDGTEIDGKWIVSKGRFENDLEEGKIRFVEKDDGEWSVQFKQYLNSEGKKPRSLTADFGSTYQGKKEISELFEEEKIFPYPKSTQLIKKLIRMSTEDGDIVMDYFAGSATSAQAVVDYNSENEGSRKYIMIQLPEETEEDSIARKEGYENIAELAKERLRRITDKIKEEQKGKLDLDDNGELDLGFKSFELSPTSFKVWRGDIEDEEQLQKQMEEFIDNLKPEAKKEFMLYELMLKNGIDLNADIEDTENYYAVNGGEYVFCLEDGINEGIVKNIIDEDPRVVVCLDVAFQDDDELKTNTALQFEEESVEFKVV